MPTSDVQVTAKCVWKTMISTFYSFSLWHTSTQHTHRDSKHQLHFVLITSTPHHIQLDVLVLSFIIMSEENVWLQFTDNLVQKWMSICDSSSCFVVYSSCEYDNRIQRMYIRLLCVHFFPSIFSSLFFCCCCCARNDKMIESHLSCACVSNANYSARHFLLRRLRWPIFENINQLYSTL